MRIDEFLLARVAEDEAVARAAIAVSSADWVANNSLLMFLDHECSALVLADVDHYSQDPAWFHVERHDPDRVLAECEAKRRIIEQAHEASSDRYSVIGEFCVGRDETQEAMDTDPGETILRALAAVYADHPDFDPTWRL